MAIMNGTKVMNGIYSGGAGKTLDDHSVVFNDFQSNEITAPYSAGFGSDNTAGYTGFQIIDITLSDDKRSAVVTLSDKDIPDKAYSNYVVGDYIQFDAKNHWYSIFRITEKSTTDDGNTVLKIAYPTNEEISHDITLDSDPMENWLWVVGRRVGLPIPSQKHIAVFGESNISAGRNTFSIGRGNQSIGNYSGTVGRNNKSGYCALVGGYGNTAMGHYSFSAGCQNTAKGIFSVALGDRVKTNKNCSMAVGQLAETNAEGSVACGISSSTGADAYASAVFGLGSHANGFASFASGEKAIANGKYSVVHGYDSVADGVNAFVAGNNCKALGKSSVAIGSRCNANHNYSFACGDLNTTQAPYQAVFGRFSLMTPEMIFGVGDGTETDYRNAFSVFEDGHAEIRTQGTTANSVVTKQYVDNLLLQIEQLKQAIVALGGTVPATAETGE